LPWYTYPAISFLGERLPSDAAVFEYGAGNSTLWYAERVREVTTVESDESWYREISLRLPANAHCVLRTERASYASEIANHDGPFDVVVIDGQWRAACAKHALDHLAPTGVVIWDNSDKFEFDGAFADVFRPAGFRELEFRGLGPVNAFMWSTSVLYRPGNLLSI
jgi:predicted O-methyltransferase YrrM